MYWNRDRRFAPDQSRGLCESFPTGRLIGINFIRTADTTALPSLPIDQSSGLLTSIGWEPTQGKTPRYFSLDPSGTHLYAANQNSKRL
jgi:6-phosphogluconolactonase